MSAAELLSKMIESDSEEDPDFVLDDKSRGSDSESENSGPETKRLRTDDAANVEDAKRAREEAWRRFQESLTSTPSESKAPVETPNMVKIEKKYRFAGRIETIIVEVPEDSPEAKQWLASQDQASPPQSIHAAQPMIPPSERPPANPPSDVHPNTTPETSSIPSEPTPPRSPPSKPRPKGGLSKLVGAKPKKLTTLQKSKMDWKTHLHSEEAQSFKDDLERNRRGGGYLEKVEFLDRVGNRLEESVSNLKNKRKR